MCAKQSPFSFNNHRGNKKMAKRKYWEELDVKEELFAQMPYSILDSDISNEAKLGFLHLWKDAFSGNKRNAGKYYSDVTQTSMAKLLGYKPYGGGIRIARKVFRELNERNVIESHKRQKEKGNQYIHYFLAKHRWILGKLK